MAPRAEDRPEVSRSRTGVGVNCNAKTVVESVRGLSDFLSHLSHCRENEQKSRLWTWETKVKSEE